MHVKLEVACKKGASAVIWVDQFARNGAEGMTRGQGAQGERRSLALAGELGEQKDSVAEMSWAWCTVHLLPVKSPE